MLLELAQWLAKDIRAFNVFSYITLRAVLACLTALLITFMVGPAMIRRLTSYKIGQSVRDDGPQSHLPKAGTPTMGGALILVAIVVTTLLWADLENRFVWVVLAVTLGFGAIGWIDDYRKGRAPQSQRAVRARQVFLAIAGRVTAACVIAFSTNLPAQTEFIVPFFKNVAYPLGVVGFIALDLSRDRRHQQRGESDRRSRRARDHADGDDRQRARRVRLRRGQRGVREISGLSATFRAPANSRCSAARWRAPGSRSCGSTPIRRKFSWATSARWRWARRSAPSR